MSLKRAPIPYPGREPSVPSPLKPDWLPWHEAALRLYFENKNLSQIARALGKEPSAVHAVMDSWEWRVRSVEVKRRYQVLYEERMQDLWKLSPQALKTMAAAMKEYQRLLKGDVEAVARQGMKGFRAARQDALLAAEDILNRTGLKAPERVELFSETHHTETSETKLTYEQRLELIRRQEALGQEPDQDLLDIRLEPQDG